MVCSESTIAAKTAETKEKKKGFSLFGGLREGLSRRRSLKEALSLLSDAADFNDAESLGKAMEAFKALPQKEQGLMMLKAQSRLQLHSISPFEEEARLAVITVLAEFFHEAAQTLPKDEAGERITDPYEKAKAALRSVVEKAEFKKSGNESHDAVVLACTKALWELELASFQFWEDRLQDPITQDFTIKKLLDMEPTENTEEHGWHLLAQHLGAAGPAIARCDSDKKTAFLAIMLVQSDRDVVKEALAAIFHLDAVPQEMMARVAELRRNDAMKAPAEAFLEAFHWRQAYIEGTETFVAAHKLIALSADARYVVPFLRIVGVDALKLALEACEDESKDGIRKGEMPIGVLADLAVRGLYPYGSESLEKMLSSIVDLSPAANIFYLWTGSIISDKSAPEQLRRTALEMQQVRLGALEEKIHDGSDMDVLNAGYELLDLYARGNKFLEPQLVKVGAEMLDMFLDPTGATDEEKIGKKKLAIDMLVRMGMAGIKVPGFELKIEKNEGEAGAQGTIVVKDVTVKPDEPGPSKDGTGDSG